tara:strand:+ start:20786 stop:21205 length:420 start_codon:yes stop_codon:yes gene_type:complete
MKLRKTTFDDWELLLNWRNDPSTRNNSFTEDKVTIETHKLWFNDSLMNPRRKIYILEENKIPVGTIRADILIKDKYLLSWSISPTQRGKGYGTKILEMYLKNKKGEFIAKIKPENIPSIKMAKNNGFKYLNETKYVKQQ